MPYSCRSRGGIGVTIRKRDSSEIRNLPQSASLKSVFPDNFCEFTLKFVDFPNEFKCSVCRDASENIYQGSCGCRYCERCFVSFQTIIPLICPNNDSDNNFSVFFDKSANREIKKLLVECPIPECNYHGPAKEVTNHFSEMHNSQANEINNFIEFNDTLAAQFIGLETHEALNITNEFAIDCFRSPMLRQPKIFLHLSNFSETLHRARNGANVSMNATCIPPFHSAYVLKAEIFPLGYGMNQRNRLSLFLTITERQGCNLHWPFVGWITVTLRHPELEQLNLTRTINATCILPRWVDKNGLFSAKFGFAEFVEVDKLLNNDYCQDDGVCFEISIIHC